MQRAPVNHPPSKQGVAFVKFTCELVSYGLLQVLGVEWKYPHYEVKGSRFDKIVGMAAVVFRHRHANEFAKNIADYPFDILENVDSTLEYIRQFIRKNFKGHVPLMEFIVYCAFVVDLTACCFEEDKRECIVEIVEETYDVYEEYIKPYFYVIGGWLAVAQMAQQYLEFVKSMKIYGSLEKTRVGVAAADKLSFATASELGNSSHTIASTLDIMSSVSDRTHASVQRNATDSADGSDSNESADFNMDVGSNSALLGIDTRAAVDKEEHCFATGSERGNDSHSNSCILSIKNDNTRASDSRLTGSAQRNTTDIAEGKDLDASAEYNMDVTQND